jgi:hypothetical protein
MCLSIMGGEGDSVLRFGFIAEKTQEEANYEPSDIGVLLPWRTG